MERMNNPRLRRLPARLGIPAIIVSPSSISTTNADFAHQLGIPVTPDPEKTYDLISLIDLAQEANPQTRIAWEQARAQAAQLGIADSDWYPSLVFMASGGYSRDAYPTPSGGLVTYGPNVTPELSLQWALLDFGRRQAKIDSAVQTLLQSNFQFNRTHQQVTYAVQTNYYAYDASVATVEAMLAALKSAQAVEEAAQTRWMPASPRNRICCSRGRTASEPNLTCVQHNAQCQTRSQRSRKRWASRRSRR